MFGRNKTGKPEKSVKLIIDAGCTPATNLETVGVDLRKRSARAGISLSKKSLVGIRGQVVMLLDYSLSMSHHYGNDSVQGLVERTLAFGLQIDADGKIPILPFSGNLLPTTEVTATSYQGVVLREIMKHPMGSTNLSAALKELIRISHGSDDPIFCLIITDGQPDNPVEVEDLVVKLSQYPVFLKFVALDSVPLLDRLNKLEAYGKTRLVDNVNSVVIRDPRPEEDGGMKDTEFYDKMVEEWDVWIEAAKTSGLLV